MKILKNYLQTILLIVAVIIGGVFGTLFPEQVMVVKPLGTLFINLIFMIIVPLIFFSISSSIAKMKHPKRLGKIMKWALIIFAITSVVSVTIGLISTYVFKPLSDADMELITNSTQYFMYENTLMFKNMFKGKKTIIPTLGVKLGCLAGKLLPYHLVCFFTFRSQKKKKS